MKKYRIFDSTNTYIRTFDSWLAVIGKLNLRKK